MILYEQVRKILSRLKPPMVRLSRLKPPMVLDFRALNLLCKCITFDRFWDFRALNLPWFWTFAP